MTDVWVVVTAEGDDAKLPTRHLIGVFSTEQRAKDVITTEAPRSGAMQRVVIDEVWGDR